MWRLVLSFTLCLAGAGAAPPIQSRIVGGWACQEDSHPWMVALYANKLYKCGGVLVHPQWVLTAAHCRSENYQVLLGKQSLYVQEEEGQFALVSESFLHPQFMTGHLLNYSHDLMLLHLTEPVQITDAVKVLDLPNQEPTVGSTCYALGWGIVHPFEEWYPLNLQCVDLRLLPQRACAHIFGEAQTGSMLCAGKLLGIQDTCLGDSGGPLICEGVYQGITSLGLNPCGLLFAPSLYTNLMPHVEWIRATIRKNS